MLNYLFCIVVEQYVFIIHLNLGIFKQWPSLNVRALKSVPFLEGIQGCALRKIEGSQIQGAQHMISMKKRRFTSRLRTKVRRKGPLGSARAQPWYCGIYL